jgi:hypothetical protein
MACLSISQTAPTPIDAVAMMAPNMYNCWRSRACFLS